MSPSTSQVDQTFCDVSLESIRKELQAFVDRGHDRRERVRVWYRRFCFENEIPLRVPYNPDLELPQAIALSNGPVLLK
jgi:hypothetical protein